MSISFEGLCRGRGKTFLRFRISNSSKLHTLKASSKSTSGIMLPCDIYNIDEDHCALAIPTLELTQRITLTHTDETKRTIDSYSKTISPTRAMWESRLTYRIKPQMAKSIRNIDATNRFKECYIEFLEAIPDKDYNIVRTRIIVPSKVTFRDLIISCMDSRGNAVDTNPIFFSESLVRILKYPITEVCHISASFKMPRFVENYCFTIQCSTIPEYSSFSVLEGWRYFDLMDKNVTFTESAQTEKGYGTWLDDHLPDQAQLNLQKHAIFPITPLFSIVVPLYKTPINFFSEMVESVTSQTYRNWELILVNASPEDERLTRTINKVADTDNRIKLLTLQSNGGISANTNAGIETTRGDFVCLFDHDDILESSLLFEYASAINRKPETDLLYCDEDKLLEDGTLCEPFLKPEYNLDLLRNNNYMCHLFAIRKSLLNQIGYLNSKYDGAQDHDLALRACEQACCVSHVSRVLYHWRASKNSTALNIDSKPFATKAGVAAVLAHLSRSDLQATVRQSRIPFSYDIVYHIPDEHPLVSIVIPNKDSVEVLDTCLKSIDTLSTYDNYEIVIVENNSSQQETFNYYDTLEANPHIKIVTYDDTFNFSAIINFGIACTVGSYCIMLNNDTEVITSDWIERMLGISQRREVGAVGVKLLYPDDTIQHAGLGVMPTVASCLHRGLSKNHWGYFGMNEREQDLSAVTAACLMVKRSVFDTVGGMTEDLEVAFNDVDFCLKLRDKGYLIVYTPGVQLYHYESFSRGEENTVDKKIRFEREIAYMRNAWASYYVNGDPYFNRNLNMSEPASSYFKLA